GGGLVDGLAGGFAGGGDGSPGCSGGGALWASGAKWNGTRILARTGLPALSAGVKRHCFTAASAASSKSAPPLSAIAASPTRPSFSTVTTTTTLLSIASPRPEVGYTASTWSRTCGGVTVVWAGGSGGGWPSAGAGARTSKAARIEERRFTGVVLTHPAPAAERETTACPLRPG